MNINNEKRELLIKEIEKFSNNADDLFVEIGVFNGKIVTSNDVGIKFIEAQNNLRDILLIKDRCKIITLIDAIELLQKEMTYKYVQSNSLDAPQRDDLIRLFSLFEIHCEAEKAADFIIDIYSNCENIYEALISCRNNMIYDIGIDEDYIQDIINYFSAENDIDTVVSAVQEKIINKAKAEKGRIETINIRKQEIQELKNRDISNEKFNTLAIGSSWFDNSGQLFTRNNTIFADLEDSDLKGDIRKTIDKIKDHKEKYSQISITEMPANVFESSEETIIFFNKLHRLLKPEGFLTVSFGVGIQRQYSNKSFTKDILIKSGFKESFVANYDYDYDYDYNNRFDYNLIKKTWDKQQSTNKSLDNNKKGVSIIVKK